MDTRPVPEEEPVIPHPVAIGMTICDAVIVEERTRKVSTIGAFTKMTLPEFPGYPPPFSVFAVLTDGQGEGTISLVVTRLDSGERVFVQHNVFHFPDVLTETNYHLRLRAFSFPEAGLYQFTILIDNEWVAHRRLQVAQREEGP